MLDIQVTFIKLCRILTMIDIQVTFKTICPILTVLLNPINQWYFSYLSRLTSMTTKLPTISPFVIDGNLSKKILLPLWIYFVFWVLWADFVLLFIFPSLTTMTEGIFLFSFPKMILPLRWCFPCIVLCVFGIYFIVYLSLIVLWFMILSL